MSNVNQESEPLAAGANPASCGVAIRRDGNVVHLSLATANDYVAIELYERLIASIKKGKLQLDMNMAATDS